jgi:predicted RNase H-like nuclease (RuvC/YqgF family)
MNSDIQRINWRVTQLERNNRTLRSKISKLEKEKSELVDEIIKNKLKDDDRK